MSNDNQTQLARELAEEVLKSCPYANCGTCPDLEQVAAIILRKLNGSGEYRRGVEDAASIADERVEFWDKGKSNMFGILLITEAEQCAAAIRALLTTEPGVSGRGEGGDADMLERMEAECDLRLQVRMDNLMEQGYSENHARIIAEQEDKPTIQQ